MKKEKTKRRLQKAMEEKEEKERLAFKRQMEDYRRETIEQTSGPQYLPPPQKMNTPMAQDYGNY